MPAFYVDTSALFKRYHSEAGSAAVHELFDRASAGDSLVTSYFTVLEMTAASLRLASGGRLTESSAQNGLAQFRAGIGREINILPLRDRVIGDALVVVEVHQLRAGDAIHLASALSLVELVAPDPVVLVSSDGELLQAGTDAGLLVLDPAWPDALPILRRLRD